LSRRLVREEHRIRDRVERGDPFWPAQLAVATAIALNFGLASPLTVGPDWLLPGVELLLLLVLVKVAPSRATEHQRGRRRFALIVIGLVSLTNVVSLGLLVDSLVNGGSVGGHELLKSGALLWATTVLLFAVWYWEMDAGGPVHRFQGTPLLHDFAFPQTDNPALAPPGWRPSFADYLYTSLTNSMAFSPTDTMPLTRTAKLVMGIQSVSALVTIGLVVARAVNILG
jgi:uncharacterized membrane protein